MRFEDISGFVDDVRKREGDIEAICRRISDKESEAESNGTELKQRMKDAVAGFKSSASGYYQVAGEFYKNRLRVELHKNKIVKDVFTACRIVADDNQMQESALRNMDSEVSRRKDEMSGILKEIADTDKEFQNTLASDRNELDNCRRELLDMLEKASKGVDGKSSQVGDVMRIGKLSLDLGGLKESAGLLNSSSFDFPLEIDLLKSIKYP